MSLLELIYVVVGIIVGLGVAEVLTGAVRVFRGELRGGLIHSLWALNIFLYLLQFVWAIWGYRDIQELNYLQYLIILWSPIVLYVAATLLFPSSASTIEETLDDFLMAHRTALVVAVLLYLVQAEVAAWMVSINPPDTLLGSLLRSAASVAVISLLLTKSRWWHRVVPIVLLGLQIYFAVRLEPIQTAG